MKKYLLLLIPLACCFGLAGLFAVTEPTEDTRDLVVQHQWMSSTWFYVGIGTTAILASTLGIYDLFEWLDRRSERQALERMNDQ